MRDDIPEWLGKPPLRGTDEWSAWLEKWRTYARAALREALKRDTAVADLVRTRAQDLTAEGRAESAAALMGRLNN